MKLIISATQICPAAGQEYLGTSYPGPGLYQNPATFEWMLVYRMPTTSLDSVMVLGKGLRPPFPCEDYQEPEVITATLEQPSGITASDLLKAIAISQNPLLAKELLK